MNMRTRALGLVLALVLLTTLLPAGVLAVENEPDGIITDGEFEVKLAESSNSEDDEAILFGSLPDGAIIKGGITRAEWMQNLVLLFGMSVSTDEYPDIYFPDVSESTDHYDAIMVAVKNGIIDIEAGDNFEPNTVLSREFAAQTLNYCLGIQKEADNYTYSDTDAVIHLDDVQVAVEQGWFALAGGSFMPAQHVTEAEVSSMLTTAAEIVDDRKLGNPVSDFEFADFVIVLPDEAEVISDYDFETERTNLTVSGYSGELEAGDTIAFFGGDLAFVYSIVSVRKVGDAFMIAAGDAPEGAVLKGEFSGELIPEVVFEEPEENSAVSLMSADGQEVVFGPVELMASSSYGKKDFGRKITIGDVTGEIYGTFSNIRMEVSNRRFVLYGTVTAHSTLDIVLAPCPLTTLSLVDVSLLKYGKISLSLELSAEARIGYYFSVDFSVGVDASGRRASLIHTAKTVDSSLTASGTISMLLKLSGKLDFGFVGNASVTLSVGPKVSAASKTYHDGSPKRCTNVTGYLYAGLKASYAFVNIDGVDMGKITDEGRGSFSKDFYTASNSPLRIVEHIEDGVTVHSCSRPNDAGQAESGYYKPKYYTPGNSRYYASGNPNGNSTGINGNGEPVVIWTTSDNDDGTVTVTGYNNSTSILNIPETIDGKTVTKIGNGAFQNNKNIRIVYMPNTITEIGNAAFRDCTNLNSIEFSDDLTLICSNAFQNTSLVSIELPEGLMYLGSTEMGCGRVFSDCIYLESVYIPSTLVEARVYTTGYEIFKNCYSLNHVTFGDGISKIPSSLFQNCSGLTYIVIPDTVTEIGSSAFRGCNNLLRVRFSQNLKIIEAIAFRDCTALTTLELPEGLLEIGYGTYWGGSFRGCSSLETVYIPSTLTGSGGGGSYGGNFEDCPLLDNIVFGEGISKISDGLFYHCDGITEITIPDTVTEIGSGAFDGCENLKKVIFSKNLTSIGSTAFRNCILLTELNLPEGLQSIGSGSYSGGAFRGCSSLKKIYIPSTLSSCPGGGSYGGNFEDCQSLTEVVWGENISAIPSGAFWNCNGLKAIAIPNTVNTIGSGSFRGCTSLINIDIPDTVTSYGGAFLQNCANLKTATLSNSVLDIPASMFSGCASLESITLPVGVTQIRNDTFNGCAALKTAVVPDTVTSVGNNAFKGCTALTDLSWLPWSITSIGSNAFENCTGLTSVTLPDDVASVGSSAFKGCTNLAAFTSNANLTSLGSNVFENDAKLVDVALNEGITMIPSYAFSGCRALETMVIPKGVTTIRNNAFYQDTKLYDFTIPETVTSIESNAFSYPRSTTVRGVKGSYAETYASWKEFIDITSHATSIALASGKTTMTIAYRNTFSPAFILSPESNTDTVVSLESKDTSVVTIQNDVNLYGQSYGTAEVVAKTSGGLEYTFTVTVDRQTGIEVTHQPDKTEYNVGDKKDMTGLVVSIAFSNGDREQVFGYDVTGLSTATTGEKTVTITRGSYNTQFPISVVRMLTGTFGNNQELTWSLGSSGQISVVGPISSNEPVYVATYDKDGKMLSVGVITVSGGNADVGNNYNRIKLIWVDVNTAPKCVNAEIGDSQ